MAMKAERTDLPLLTDAVQGAGAIALHYVSRNFKIWEKGKNDPVSDADLAVNRYLKARLEAARPAYGWLSEENEDDPRRLAKDNVWVVDPIDGTRAFIQGRPDFAVSVALVRQGRPILGVVYRPMTGDLFTAEAGGGAWLNGGPISPSNRADFDHCATTGDAGYLSSKKIWPRPIPHAHCEACNSIALRLCLVASGSVDYAVTLRPKNDWDIAAADIILSEAGGRLDSGEGGPHRYNAKTPKLPRVVAANPQLFDRVMDRVSAAVANPQK